jgi:hypothetical protein
MISVAVAAKVLQLRCITLNCMAGGDDDGRGEARTMLTKVMLAKDYDIGDASLNANQTKIASSVSKLMLKGGQCWQRSVMLPGDNSRGEAGEGDGLPMVRRFAKAEVMLAKAYQSGEVGC